MCIEENIVSGKESLENTFSKVVIPTQKLSDQPRTTEPGLEQGLVFSYLGFLVPQLSALWSFS